MILFHCRTRQNAEFHTDVLAYQGNRASVACSFGSRDSGSASRPFQASLVSLVRFPNHDGVSG